MPHRDNEHQAGERSQRQLRVGEELRPGEMRDPILYHANVTVTEVQVSPDLRSATAFVMPLGGANSADIVAALWRSAPYLKGRVARSVQLRRVPDLSFALDSAFDSADRIAAVLHSDAVARDLQDKDGG